MKRALKRRRRGLTRLAVLAGVALGLLVGGFVWLRQSDLVAVEQVTVHGLSGENARRITAALTTAGREMTTLAVDEDALRRAVREYPDVAAVSASAGFPRRLTVTVTERDPVGVVSVGGRRIPVAPDGTLLTRDGAGGRLPEIGPEAERDRGRVAGRAALAVVDLLAAAPPALRPRVRRGGFGRRGQGLRVELREGPAVVFGGRERLEAKWAAAARVLADADAAGARYVDVRIPERPAVGGLPAEPTEPETPPDAGTSEQDSTSPPA